MNFTTNLVNYNKNNDREMIALTCLIPWNAHSQNMRREEKKDTWNIASNSPGTQLCTRNIRGNNGSRKFIKMFVSISID